jgi:carboxypeptidase C (cathepsin A)
MTDKKSNTKIKHALLRLHELVDHDEIQSPEFPNTIKTFLVDIITAAADIVELGHPSSSHILYADLEAIMKSSGERQISHLISQHPSVSQISENNTSAAIDYVAQHLSIALVKSIHELPQPLRQVEIMLYAIEVILLDIIRQRAPNDPQLALDSFFEHARKTLIDIPKPVKH